MFAYHFHMLIHAGFYKTGEYIYLISSYTLLAKIFLLDFIGYRGRSALKSDTYGGMSENEMCRKKLRETRTSIKYTLYFCLLFMGMNGKCN